MAEADQREETVFEMALKVPADERAAYLGKICAGDADLRRRVEVLLGAFERAGGFMKEPVVHDFSKTARIPVLPAEKPGDRIGRYKLLEQIGEGGCGVVYVAEQEEPVRRRVALKVIKLGMDTKEVMARFDAERQALAMMDHPNIAKVLDAGATEAGRPYFVMELVRGIKITDYCDQNHLAPRQRLDLFIQVCRAIQHAHQKGIIHRDIKPSNILVASNDGAPIPKVIDFGIAKATQGRLTDQTVYTAFEQFIGTPAYMSPEQAAMTMLDIDTRSDIYSLGVLLYELLTGKTPFDAKDLLAAGLDEMRRTIREVEPVKPSTRLTQERATRSAGSGKSEIRNPKSEINQDLDWIVMKCLEKDRTRRYETANGLATDIRRHLHNEPVVARPPSPVYRLRKLVQRNRLAFAAGVMLTTVLVLGVIGSTWQAVRATRAEREQSRLRLDAEAARNNEANLRTKAEADERKAQTEALRSAQVAQFMKDMLAGVRAKVALGRDTRLLHDILDDTAERIGRELKDQPEIEAELLSTIGGTYLQLFDLSKAEATLQEALRLRKSIFGETNAAVAASLNDLARVLVNRGANVDLEQAEAMTRQALSIWESLSIRESQDVAESFSFLGGALWHQKRFVDAESPYRQSLAICKKLFGSEHKQYWRVANALVGLATALLYQGRLEEAEKAIHEALGIQRKVFGEEHPDIADTLELRGRVLNRQRHRWAEAEAALQESLAMRRKFHSNDSQPVVAALNHLADLYRVQTNFAAAEAVYRECIAICEKSPSAEAKTFLAVLTCRLGLALFDQRKYEEAEPYLLAGYAALKPVEDKDAWDGTKTLRRVMTALVKLYGDTNRPDKSAEWKQKLAEFSKTTEGK